MALMVVEQLELVVAKINTGIHFFSISFCSIGRERTRVDEAFLSHRDV
jgi:hypothetical protein